MCKQEDVRPSKIGQRPVMSKLRAGSGIKDRMAVLRARLRERTAPE